MYLENEIIPNKRRNGIADSFLGTFHLSRFCLGRVDCCDVEGEQTKIKLKLFGQFLTKR